MTPLENNDLYLIIGYWTSNIMVILTHCFRGNSLSPHRLLFYDRQQGIFYMRHPTDRIAQTMAFVEPIMDHWFVQVIYTYPLSLMEGFELVSGLIIPCLNWDQNPVPTILMTDGLCISPTNAWRTLELSAEQKVTRGLSLSM